MITRCSYVFGFIVCFTATHVVWADEPWVPLFDGHTLNGWQQRGGRATYEVSDGAIVGRSVPNTPNSFLCTTRDYRNFELTYEFKCDSELNSGVQIRSVCNEKETLIQLSDGVKTIRAGRVHGYQVEIDPNAPTRMWTGGIYDEARRGWLYPGLLGGDSVQFTEIGQSLYKPDAWNHVRVECLDSRIRTWLNGTLRADFEDNLTPAGFVALLVHGVGARDEPLTVRWRKLMIREHE